MRGRLIVVSGTGTGIGKSHVSEALLLALGRLPVRAAGLKPIETGLEGLTDSDAARLRRASTFHVEHFGFVYPEPVSPHLAARLHSNPIRLDAILSHVCSVRGEADVTLVELPGGLFTPLSDHDLNADLARDLAPDAVLLVAPDRLGVLHDVEAVARAATTVPIALAWLLLVAPERTDASTGRNAPELSRLLPGLPVLAVPRASVNDLATVPGIADLAARLIG